MHLATYIISGPTHQGKHGGYEVISQMAFSEFGDAEETPTADPLCTALNPLRVRAGFLVTNNWKKPSARVGFSGVHSSSRAALAASVGSDSPTWLVFHHGRR